MRLFAAIKIPDDIANVLARLGATLAGDPSLPGKVKWVEAHNLHFTLKFFGEIEENRLKNLEECLAEAAKSSGPIEYALKGLGAFPNAARARVLWAGIDNAADKFSLLAGAVEKNTAGKNFPPSDKPFSPHLTLARFAEAPQRSFADLLAKYTPREFGRATALKMDLIQSRLSSRGPVYETLREFPLREN